ncbi:peptide-methionine (R)-S-oxide reductase [bacterium]|nr:peptide-methionine (R)-S-oxide reductase [bacterium]
MFVCRACGNHLYDSSSKFDAGCGWPELLFLIEENNCQRHPFYNN